MNRKHLIPLLAVALTVISLAAFLSRSGQARSAAQGSDVAEAAPAAVQTAVPDNLWINLQNGLPIAATYTGLESATRILTEGRAEPLSLVSADFDGDGTDDLAIGYADAAGGLLVVQAGNPDFMYPDSLAAKAHRATGTFV
ncbi:MAG: hypothetical protein FJ011_26630, partial [Chloroflexi bacterium]|nr:hypothetical protein [Chloroflexota bacterium]